jgi:hypothetical protein
MRPLQNHIQIRQAPLFRIDPRYFNCESWRTVGFQPTGAAKSSRDHTQPA